MPPPVRLALAGCGRIARNVHLPALTARRSLEVILAARVSASGGGAVRVA